MSGKEPDKNNTDPLAQTSENTKGAKWDSPEGELKIGWLFLCILCVVATALVILFPAIFGPVGLALNIVGVIALYLMARPYSFGKRNKKPENEGLK
jgi:hypothetical protein